MPRIKHFAPNFSNFSGGGPPDPPPIALPSAKSWIRHCLRKIAQRYLQRPRAVYKQHDCVASLRGHPKILWRGAAPSPKLLGGRLPPLPPCGAATECGIGFRVLYSVVLWCCKPPNVRDVFMFRNFRGGPRIAKYSSVQAVKFEIANLILS